MSKTVDRWCVTCDKKMPHDKLGTLDGYSGHSALWLDHILFRSDIEEVYACQKCGKRCKVKKYA